jgi:hypothetical protein
MDLLHPIPPSYRVAALALAASAVLHGTALVGYRVAGEEVSLEAPSYTATLEPARAVEAAPVRAAAPAPKPRPPARKAEPRPGEAVAFLPEAIEAADLAPPPATEAPLPDMVALAQPAVPIALPEIPPFRADALPEKLSISYALTSAFADGEAEYTWEREGDRYEITGSAQASGFFAVFLEGTIYQVASGRVTPEGLRPEKFTERRGSTPEEGLAFDWDARQVEFRRGDSRRTGPLTDSTVDWLSMIFQLAHVPFRGETLEIRVFTQRRMYQYKLDVVGVEELDLPIGRARAVHLRHAGEKPEEAVDVWLGVNQYYLPVKLRYPVARNRLVVEQTATSVKAR